MDVMQARRRLLMMQSELPSAYRRVEWIGGSGTQYIATSYIPSAGFSTNVEYLYRNHFNGEGMIFGAAQSNTVRAYMDNYLKSTWYAANGESRYVNVLNGSGTGTNVKYLAHIDSTRLEIEGTSVPPNSTVTSPSIPIYIFAWNNAGTVQHEHPVLNLYSLTFHENGRLAADFLPCVRKSDNKPGMYDTVSKTFYTNAGTGEFIVPN